MAAYITVLNYVYSLCVFYYSVLSCVADVADCPLQRLSAIVIKNIIIIITTIHHSSALIRFITYHGISFAAGVSVMSMNVIFCSARHQELLI